MNFFSEFVQTLNELPWLFYTYVTILGLLIGSFLNVVIYRLPVMMENSYKDEYSEYFYPDKELPKREKFNLMFPRSRCPNCGHKITAWENIPVISFLVLRGKCHGCGQPISWRYPLVEAFTGLISLILALHFGPTIQLVGALILVWSLIAVSGIDYDKMIIPDEIVFPILWLGVLLNLNNTYVSIQQSIYGAVLGYLVLWGFYWMFKLITGKEGMGYGDFKLVACLGAWLGSNMLFAIIVGSAFLGAVIGGSYIIFKSKSSNKQIPFGPYIAVSGFLVLWGKISIIGILI
jgi:leader peptidase (prepilin peptidase) / N-methyltransferase